MAENLNGLQNAAENQAQQQQSMNINVTVTSPVSQLKTDRGLVKTILLSILTLGIYSLVVDAHISEDINVVCSRYDGKKTMNFWLLTFIVGPLTCGIGYLVWRHKLNARMGAELKRRNIDYNFGAADYWLWCILGVLIIVGPFVYLYKYLKAINLINADFNQNG